MPSALKREHPTYEIFSIFAGHFSPPGSGSTGLNKTGSNWDPDPKHLSKNLSPGSCLANRSFCNLQFCNITPPSQKGGSWKSPTTKNLHFYKATEMTGVLTSPLLKEVIYPTIFTFSLL
jgi:hypothetical protein